MWWVQHSVLAALFLPAVNKCSSATDSDELSGRNLQSLESFSLHRVSKSSSCCGLNVSPKARVLETESPSSMLVVFGDRASWR